MATDNQEPAPEAIENEARSIGWVPKEEFHGNAENWVDAKTFVEKGKTFIPFLQADRRKLQGQVTALQGENSQLKTELTGIRESVDTLKQYNSQTRVAQLESEVSGLRRQLAEARKEGDTDAEVSLEAKLDETREQLKEEKANGKPPAAGQPPAGGVRDFTREPEFQQFLQDNPWWQNDPVMRAASLVIGNELASQGALTDLQPAQRFAKIAEATKKRFGVTEQPRRSRVEGGGGGGGSGSNSGPAAGKSFSDLPPDAQAACDRMYPKLKTAYPKKEDWQRKYAQDYFNS